ncbi:MAG: uroporphyrinogen-III C-methyltransferase [Bryobacteraceae bacterium]
MVSSSRPGTVYLTGAGPGDPDLLTVAAARVLARADAVFYDRLVSPEILALASPRAELIYVGKEAGEQDAVQPAILRQLTAAAWRHSVVVRLKGGDPMVFGRGGEEWAHLAARGIPVTLIPGISSAVSVPGLAGIPLTLRGVARSFAVITGHEQNGGHENWAAYRSIDTLVILMGVAQREAIAASLIAFGRPASQPAAFIERGSTDRERTVVTTLGEIARGETDVASPAVFVVGEVVRQREALFAMAEELESAVA